eukprot:762907-Hanusia_phi.AAC.3
MGGRRVIAFRHVRSPHSGPMSPGIVSWRTDPSEINFFTTYLIVSTGIAKPAGSTYCNLTSIKVGNGAGGGEAGRGE